MKAKKLSFKIFVLPYICTSIILLYFFKTTSMNLLNFSLLSAGITTFWILIEFIFLKIYQKNFDKVDNNFFSKALKVTTALSLLYAILCSLLFIINLFAKIFSVHEMLICIISLFYSVFPITLFLLSEISFFKLSSALKNKNIKLNTPDIIEDIYNSQILIIDNFETFLNTDNIKSIAEHKKTVLISKLDKKSLCLKFPSLLSTAEFYDISSDELPKFKSYSISVYSSADVFSVIRLIKLINKSFIVVSEKDLNTLCCKISHTKDSDVKIPQNNIDILKTLLDLILLHFNKFQKCLTYQITLSLAKIICTFTCIFFCSYIPFEPVMLIFAGIICDFLPMLAFVFDKTQTNSQCLSLQNSFSHIILDSLLLGFVSFIVFMLASLAFSYPCASVICINTYIISSLLYAINLRYEKSIFFVGIMTNKLTNFSFLSGVTLTVLITLFIYNDTASITASGWILIAVMSLIPFIANQLQKAVISFFYK